MDAWAVTGQVHDRAWTLVRLAECQIAASDRASAAESLLEARQIGLYLRAIPLLHAVADVTRRGRLPDPDSGGRAEPRREERHGLTVREVEALHLIADGRTNDQIAAQLFISPKTASVHVSHILTKLDVTSRSAATTAAHHLHLLDDNP
ncbi:MAG: helix-turn-helix domain-containing protein [Nocardioidaceae bacterium]